MTQNLWDAAKSVLRGKFIAIQAYLKKQQPKNQQPDFTPKATRKKKKRRTLKVSRRKEIIKIRAVINEIKTTETIPKISKIKADSLQR